MINPEIIFYCIISIIFGSFITSVYWKNEYINTDEVVRRAVNMKYALLERNKDLEVMLFDIKKDIKSGKPKRKTYIKEIEKHLAKANAESLNRCYKQIKFPFQSSIKIYKNPSIKVRLNA